MKAVVLLDVYRYETEPGVVAVAYKGDEVEVSDAEFKRATSSDTAGLAKVGSKAAKAAKTADAEADDAEPSE